MEKYFVQANFDGNNDYKQFDGINSLNYSTFSSRTTKPYLISSINLMISDLSLCDFLYYGKINNRDIFCIYYAYKLDELTVKEAIKEVVEDGIKNNIINRDKVYIKSALWHLNCSMSDKKPMFCNDTTFWDVTNNYAIIADYDNCLKTAYVLETERYRDTVNLFKNTKAYEYVNDYNIHPFTKKIKAHRI